MDYKKLALRILTEAEMQHLNLYHDVSEQQVVTFIESVDWNNLDEVNFDLQMLKLFALFKDAHTNYDVGRTYIDKKPIYIEGKLYILHNGKYREIKQVGNLSSKEFLKELASISNYETQEYLNESIRTLIKNGYVYQMLKLVNNKKIQLRLKNGRSCEISLITKTEAFEKGIETEIIPYEYKILDDNILYVIYRKCEEMENFPFASMVEEIEKEIERKNITDYILDLRGNHGGHSDILNSFEALVKKENLKGVLLIDNGTFSAARHGVAKFKKRFNTPLIGEGTGGAAKSYGWMIGLEVEGKHFSVSLHEWDFSSIFGYTGSIQPDIYVEKTLKDIKLGKDSQLETAIEFIKNEVKTID